MPQSLHETAKNSESFFFLHKKRLSEHPFLQGVQLSLSWLEQINSKISARRITFSTLSFMNPVKFATCTTFFWDKFITSVLRIYKSCRIHYSPLSIISPRKHFIFTYIVYLCRKVAFAQIKKLLRKQFALQKRK